MTPISRKTNQWIALVVGNLTIPCVVAWKYHSGEANARVAVIVALASILIFNVPLLIAIRSQTKKLGQPVPRSFYAGTVSMGILSVSLTAAAVHSLPQRNSYLDLALSGTPTDEIEPKEKALVVEYMRRDLAASNAFDKLEAHDRLAAQTNALPALYSPASFANVSVMHALSDQIKEAYETDLAYYRLCKTTRMSFMRKWQKLTPVI